MPDNLHGLNKQDPAISRMTADIGLWHTGVTVGSETDPTFDTPKFILTPDTIDIELYYELNATYLDNSTFVTFL